MVNWNCAPGGTAPDRFELTLVSAGPIVVVVHEAALLPLATSCSFIPLMVMLFTSGAFTPTLASTVAVSSIVPLMPAAMLIGGTPVGAKVQVTTWPFTLVGVNETLSGVLVK